MSVSVYLTHNLIVFRFQVVLQRCLQSNLPLISTRNMLLRQISLRITTCIKLPQDISVFALELGLSHSLAFGVTHIPSHCSQ